MALPPPGISGDPELRLLNRSRKLESGGTLAHELTTAPLFTYDAYNIDKSLFPQRGLLGAVLRQTRTGFPSNPKDKRIYINTNTPASALVCGVQGSGKSHTVSCLLEASLIKDPQIGNLPEPLAGLVFHYDEENAMKPCEAAYLSMPDPESESQTAVKDIAVLVSPSNLQNMTKVYSVLPRVKVQPLRLSERNLNASRMLSLMGCDDIDGMPLYMHTALSILREMGTDNFNYQIFKRRLRVAGFNPSQTAMTKLRTDLLDSYLGNTGDIINEFRPGKLVIVDLSDPFLSGQNAAVLFDIILGLFTEWQCPSGKVVVLDEAHKYLTNSDAVRLTKSVCSLIRQQRHLAMRIIISTQEPTIVPASILDLTSFIICHKFSSPAWCHHLKAHISVGDKVVTDEDILPWFEEVMQLRTGQALLFSSGTVGLMDDGITPPDRHCISLLGVGYLLIHTRPRITCDGGASIMAVGHEQYSNPQQLNGSVPADSGWGSYPISPSQPDPPQTTQSSWDDYTGPGYNEPATSTRSDPVPATTSWDTTNEPSTSTSHYEKAPAADNGWGAENSWESTNVSDWSVPIAADPWPISTREHSDRGRPRTRGARGMKDFAPRGRGQGKGSFSRSSPSTTNDSPPTILRNHSASSTPQVPASDMNNESQPVASSSRSWVAARMKDHANIQPFVPRTTVDVPSPTPPSLSTTRPIQSSDRVSAPAPRPLSSMRDSNNPIPPHVPQPLIILEPIKTAPIDDWANDDPAASQIDYGEAQPMSPLIKSLHYNRSRTNRPEFRQLVVDHLNEAYPWALADANCITYDEYFALGKPLVEEGKLSPEAWNKLVTAAPEFAQAGPSAPSTSSNPSTSNDRSSRQSDGSKPRLKGPNVAAAPFIPAEPPFKLLVDLLEENFNHNIPRPLQSELARIMLTKQPRIFVSKDQNEYFAEAERLGIVYLGDFGGPSTAWVELREEIPDLMKLPNSPPKTQRQPVSARPYVPPPRRLPPSPRPEHFKDLVDVLNSMWNTRPFFCDVEKDLLQLRPNIFEQTGYLGFEEYVKAAALAGVVRIGGERTTSWVEVAN